MNNINFRKLCVMTLNLNPLKLRNGVIAMVIVLIVYNLRHGQYFIQIFSKKIIFP